MPVTVKRPRPLRTVLVQRPRKKPSGTKINQQKRKRLDRSGFVYITWNVATPRTHPSVNPEGNPAPSHKMRHCASVVQGPLASDHAGSCLVLRPQTSLGLDWPTGLRLFNTCMSLGLLNESLSTYSVHATNLVHWDGSLFRKGSYSSHLVTTFRTTVLCTVWNRWCLKVGCHQHVYNLSSR